MVSYQRGYVNFSSHTYERKKRKEDLHENLKELDHKNLEICTGKNCRDAFKMCLFVNEGKKGEQIGGMKREIYETIEMC